MVCVPHDTQMVAESHSSSSSPGDQLDGRSGDASLVGCRDVQKTLQGAAFYEDMTDDEILLATGDLQMEPVKVKDRLNEVATQACKMSDAQWETFSTHLVGHALNARLHKPSRLCLLYTSPSPRDRTRSRMPSSA